MNDLKLDKEELEILESFERREWHPVSDRENELERHRQYAEATLKKNRRVNIRISDYDFNALRKYALKEGVPYQNFISGILHKYVSGVLAETKSLNA
ncbi:MAG: antitoxin [Desulfobacteraceae bacterium]|nr:antitoxin [Desulfobacteraceae bacterium]